MSGGHFDYKQQHIYEIACLVEDQIRNNNKVKGDSIFDEPNNFSENTLVEFRKGVELLRKAKIYAQRIDWLLSGDDGEETFHKRLAEDLSELEILLKNRNKNGKQRN